MTATTSHTVKKPSEAQMLTQLAVCIEERIDLWLDQERRITVSEIRTWQQIIRDVAQRLTEREE